MKKFILFLVFLLSLIVMVFVGHAQVQVITLNGTASKDSDGMIVKWRWQQIGTTPSLLKIANDTVALTTVVPANGLQWVTGVYSLQLTVTDNGGASKSDTVRVTVNASAPRVDAGANQAVTLPIVAVDLKATATVTLGKVRSWAWTQISGPSAAVFNRKDTSTVKVSGLLAGVYWFRMTIVDNYGASANDSVQVIVQAANVVPRSNAGPDQVITLPVQSVAIGGADSPTDATIQWVKLQGPLDGTIASPNASFTQVTGLVAGTYVFEKSVSAGGMTARDVVYVTVKKGCAWWKWWC